MKKFIDRTYNCDTIMFEQGKRGPIAAGAETQGNSASGEFWQK